MSNLSEIQLLLGYALDSPEKLIVFQKQNIPQ